MAGWPAAMVSVTFPAMTAPSPCLYVDVVDPLSFVMHLEVRQVEESRGMRVRRLPLEVRPAPAELTDVDDPAWTGRWAEAESLLDVRGVTLVRPTLVPSSRKAHELLTHVGSLEGDVADRAFDVLFAAFFMDGRDIGRVDVLVGLGQSLGLDLTETKAVLDVDRCEEDVMQVLEGARLDEIESPPVLTMGTNRLQGFHNQTAIGTFLAAP